MTTFFFGFTLALAFAFGGCRFGLATTFGFGRCAFGVVTAFGLVTGFGLTGAAIVSGATGFWAVAAAGRVFPTAGETCFPGFLIGGAGFALDEEVVVSFAFGFGVGATVVEVAGLGVLVGVPDADWLFLPPDRDTTIRATTTTVASTPAITYRRCNRRKSRAFCTFPLPLGGLADCQFTSFP